MLFPVIVYMAFKGKITSFYKFHSWEVRTLCLVEKNKTTVTLLYQTLSLYGRKKTIALEKEIGKNHVK